MNENSYGMKSTNSNSYQYMWMNPRWHEKTPVVFVAVENTKTVRPLLGDFLGMFLEMQVYTRYKLLIWEDIFAHLSQNDMPNMRESQSLIGGHHQKRGHVTGFPSSNRQPLRLLDRWGQRYLSHWGVPGRVQPTIHRWFSVSVGFVSEAKPKNQLQIPTMDEKKHPITLVFFAQKKGQNIDLIRWKRVYFNHIRLHQVGASKNRDTPKWMVKIMV